MSVNETLSHESELYHGMASWYERVFERFFGCLLNTSDAADDSLCVDLGGRRIIKKKICAFVRVFD